MKSVRVLFGILKLKFEIENLKLKFFYLYGIFIFFLNCEYIKNDNFVEIKFFE